MASTNPPYDVFISFKHSARGGGATPDAEAARAVYNALTAAGIRTFFSVESLKQDGKGLFSKSIEAALESARFLVLVASCREHIESKWVEAEWDMFLHEVLSGQKPDGDLVILNCGDLQPAKLPLFLRRHSVFGMDEIGAIVKVVKSSLPKPIRLADVIRASLHCFEPKAKKDKIYLVTAHAPTGSEYVIKTHWGGRHALRLASMVKKSGILSVGEIKKAVKDIVDEKTRGSERYVAKAWKSLLTLDAMRALAAELGVEQSVKRPGGRVSTAQSSTANRKRLGRKR